MTTLVVIFWLMSLAVGSFVTFHATKWWYGRTIKKQQKQIETLKTPIR